MRDDNSTLPCCVCLIQLNPLPCSYCLLCMGKHIACGCLPTVSACLFEIISPCLWEILFSSLLSRFLSPCGFLPLSKTACLSSCLWFSISCVLIFSPVQLSLAGRLTKTTFWFAVLGGSYRNLLEVPNQALEWKATNVSLMGESGIIGAFRNVTSDQSAKAPRGEKNLEKKLNCEKNMEVYCANERSLIRLL